MDNYTSVIIEDLSKISNRDIEEWNKIANSVFTKYEFIKIFENENLMDIKPKHILVYNKKKKLVGFAIFYIENQKTNLTFEDAIYGKFSKFLNNIISLKPSLICYIPEGSAIKAIEAKHENETIYEKIIDTMSEIAKKEKIKQYAIYYIQENSKTLINVLNKKKFNKVFSSFTSYIDITWESFDDYIKSMSRPKKIRREIRKNNEMDVKIEELDSNSHFLSDVSSVINLNLNKYSEKPMIVSESFLKKILIAFPKEVKIYKVILKDEFIGGMLCFKEKDFFYTGKGGQINIDFKNYSFFESAIYTPVRIAIEEKIPKVILGTHAYSYKKERGAKTSPLYIYIKSHSTIRNFILKYLFLFIHKYKYNKHSKMLNSISQKNNNENDED